MKFVAAVFLTVAALSAQTASTSEFINTSKAFYAQAKNNILRSADKIPEDLWSFQPTPQVRTVAQMFAHVADGQYELCGIAVEGKPVSKNIEKTAKTKADITAALKEAFSYCDSAYAKMTDATAAEMVPFFGGNKVPRLGAMDYNNIHTMEHYGNLITYMRLKNIVPPSSERPPAPAKKK
jgi:uncharacterized damage-inducible protein DinB